MLRYMIRIEEVHKSVPTHHQTISLNLRLVLKSILEPLTDTIMNVGRHFNGVHTRNYTTNQLRKYTPIYHTYQTPLVNVCTIYSITHLCVVVFRDWFIIQCAPLWNTSLIPLLNSNAFSLKANGTQQIHIKCVLISYTT